MTPITYLLMCILLIWFATSITYVPILVSEGHDLIATEENHDPLTCVASPQVTMRSCARAERGNKVDDGEYVAPAPRRTSTAEFTEVKIVVAHAKPSNVVSPQVATRHTLQNQITHLGNLSLISTFMYKSY